MRAWRLAALHDSHGWSARPTQLCCRPPNQATQLSKPHRPCLGPCPPHPLPQAADALAAPLPTQQARTRRRRRRHRVARRWRERRGQQPGRQPAWQRGAGTAAAAPARSAGLPERPPGWWGADHTLGGRRRQPGMPCPWRCKGSTPWGASSAAAVLEHRVFAPLSLTFHHALIFDGPHPTPLSLRVAWQAASVYVASPQ